MPQLRSCYFCGVVGDSLREYDLAPGDLTPTEGSHSAVLCSTCHEKLRRVLEPLTDGSSERSADSIREGSAQSITFGGDGASPDGRDDSADAGGSETPTGSTAEADGTKAEADRDGTEDAGTRADPTADAPAAADPAEDGPSETDDGDDSGREETDSDVPESYYKVLRLLQNREFPMERAELTTLVTAAYDVSEPQCERVLETAIERGVLVEDGSTLDLGRN